jgi:excisionase family DNA binding protein
MHNQVATSHPILLTRKACAAALGISLRKLDSLIASKALPTRRIGRKRLIAYQAALHFARSDHI